MSHKQIISSHRILTVGSLAMWKARRAVVNNCSKVHVLGTVIARNIRRRNEQLPSNTFIVSENRGKGNNETTCCYKKLACHLHPCLLCLSFSPYLSRLCAPNHCVHWNFPTFHIHRHENVQHHHCSSRLICSGLWEFERNYIALWNWIQLKLLEQNKRLKESEIEH